MGTVTTAYFTHDLDRLQTRESGTATGQLTQIAYTNSIYSKDLTYNSNGLLKDETVKITGGATGGYKTSYGYDSYLRLSTTTYPDNDVVTVSYNSMGLPAKLVSSASGTLVDGLKDVKAFTEAVDYDAAGRIYDMRFPAGGNIWRRQGYHGWNTTNGTYAGNGEGRLSYIFVGTTQGGLNLLNLNYSYDSYGNVARHYDNAGYNSFSYDDQNRLTNAYSKVYDNDTSGRLTSYEGVNQPVSTAFPGHAIKKSGYTYNANGNLITRAGKTLEWDVQNRLYQVKNGSTVEESYLYDDNGIRVKKTVGSTNSYYPFAHYEVNGSTVIKYYFFAGMRIATKKGSTLYYLHTDQLGSIVLTNGVNQHQEYCAYGRKRSVSGSTTTCGGSNTLTGTDHTFTGQQVDATGLMYYQSRYYDPEIGAFISPDTIVPDASVLIDYNRYTYSRANPLKYNDPSGHCVTAQPSASDSEAYREWSRCWTNVNTILQQWDTTPAYWNGRYSSKEWFGDKIAERPDLKAAFFDAELLLWQQSDDYATWQAAHPTAPVLQNELDDPQCGGGQACQALLRGVKNIDEYCNQKDCITQSLDVVATGSASVAAGCAVGIVTAPCSFPAAGVSVLASGAGAVWTAYQVNQHNGDEYDLITVGTTLTIGINSTPVVGFLAGFYQTYWDFTRTYPEDDQ